MAIYEHEGILKFNSDNAVQSSCFYFSLSDSQQKPQSGDKMLFMNFSLPLCYDESTTSLTGVSFVAYAYSSAPFPNWYYAAGNAGGIYDGQSDYFLITQNLQSRDGFLGSSNYVSITVPGEKSDDWGKTECSFYFDNFDTNKMSSALYIIIVPNLDYYESSIQFNSGYNISFAFNFAESPHGSFFNSTIESSSLTNIINYSSINSKWNYSDSDQIDGFEIRYALDSSFSADYDTYITRVDNSTTTYSYLPNQERSYYLRIYPYNAYYDNDGTYKRLYGSPLESKEFKFYKPIVQFDLSYLNFNENSAEEINNVLQEIESKKISISWVNSFCSLKKQDSAGNITSLEGYDIENLVFSYKKNNSSFTKSIAFSSGSFDINGSTGDTFNFYSVRTTLVNQTFSQAFNITFTLLASSSLKDITIIPQYPYGDKYLSVNITANITNYDENLYKNLSFVEKYTDGTEKTNNPSMSVSSLNNGEATYNLSIRAGYRAGKIIKSLIFSFGGSSPFNYEGQKNITSIEIDNLQIPFIDQWNISLSSSTNYSILDNNYFYTDFIVKDNSEYALPVNDAINYNISLINQRTGESYTSDTKALTTSLHQKTIFSIARETLLNSGKFSVGDIVDISYNLTANDSYKLDLNLIKDETINNFEIAKNVEIGSFVITDSSLEKFNLDKWNANGEIEYQETKFSYDYEPGTLIGGDDDANNTFSVEFYSSHDGLTFQTDEQLREGTISVKENAPIGVPIQIVFKLTHFYESDVISSQEVTAILTLNDSRAPYIKEDAISILIDKTIENSDISYFIPSYSSLKFSGLNNFQLGDKGSYQLVISKDDWNTYESFGVPIIFSSFSDQLFSFDTSLFTSILHRTNKEDYVYGLKFIVNRTENGTRSEKIFTTTVHPIYFTQPKITVSTGDWIGGSEPKIYYKQLVDASAFSVSEKIKVKVIGTITDSTAEENGTFTAKELRHLISDNEKHEMSIDLDNPDYSIKSGVMSISSSVVLLITNEETGEIDELELLIGDSPSPYSFVEDVGEIAVRKHRVGLHGPAIEGTSLTIYSVTAPAQDKFLTSFYNGSTFLGGFTYTTTDVIIDAGEWK